jgi:hypothetical protein
MNLSRTEQLRDYYFCLKKVKKSLVKEKVFLARDIRGRSKANFFFEILLIFGRRN